ARARCPRRSWRASRGRPRRREPDPGEFRESPREICAGASCCLLVERKGRPGLGFFAQQLLEGVGEPAPRVAGLVVRNAAPRGLLGRIGHVLVDEANELLHELVARTPARQLREDPNAPGMALLHHIELLGVWVGGRYVLVAVRDRASLTPCARTGL